MKYLDYIIYKIIILFFKLIGAIPKKYAFKISGFLGRLWFLLDKNHRETALKNLTNAFGKELSRTNIKKIALKVFQNILLMPFEIGLTLCLKPEDRDEHVTIKGFSNLKKASEKNKGIILLGGHFGNWEFASIVLNSFDMPVTGVYRSLKFKPLDKAIYDIRTRFGGELFPLYGGSSDKIFEFSKKNALIYLLIDQNVSKLNQAVFVDFFDRKASTNKGIAKIAILTGAPVIPFFMIRNKERFTAEFLPEIELIKTGDMTKDIEENTRIFTAVLEKKIKNYPDQWFWIHKRWKTKPYKLLSERRKTDE